MGVCCIVFDIDGMLFEFFMNFLNIEKKINLNFFCFQYFKFTSSFMLFPTLKKIWCQKNKNPGGGGGVDFFFFVEKQLFLISRLMLFSTLKKILKSAPSLTG